MTSKQRLKDIERRIKPAQKFTVIWEDPDQKGVFYNHPNYTPDRKRLSPEEVQRLRDDPGVLIEVSYEDKWRGPKRDLD